MLSLFSNFSFAESTNGSSDMGSLLAGEMLRGDW